MPLLVYIQNLHENRIGPKDFRRCMRKETSDAHLHAHNFDLDAVSVLSESLTLHATIDVPIPFGPPHEDRGPISPCFTTPPPVLCCVFDDSGNTEGERPPKALASRKKRRAAGPHKSVRPGTSPFIIKTGTCEYICWWLGEEMGILQWF